MFRIPSQRLKHRTFCSALKSHSLAQGGDGAILFSRKFRKETVRDLMVLSKALDIANSNSTFAAKNRHLDPCGSSQVGGHHYKSSLSSQLLRKSAVKNVCHSLCVQHLDVSF